MPIDGVGALLLHIIFAAGGMRELTLTSGGSMTSAAELVGIDHTSRKWSWRSARNTYRGMRWRIIAILALIALILGMIGLAHTRLPATGTHSPPQPIPWPDRFYYAVGLFRFASPPADFPLSGYLEVARWLAPFTLLLAGLGAISSIFTEQLTQLRVYGWYRNHWVVCGAGRVGMRLTTTFRRNGTRVVVIDHDPLVSDIEECRQLGVPVIKGDATDPVVLKRANIQKARYLVAVSGDDGINAEVAVHSNTLIDEKRQLTCYVNVHDKDLSVLLDQSAAFEPNRDIVQYRFFNIFQEGPRALIQEGRLLRHSDDGRPPCLLVMGAGFVAVNLVMEAAHWWEIEHGEEGPRLQIVLVDVDAQVRVKEIHEWRPRLARACDLLALARDPWDPHSDPFAHPASGPLPIPTTAVVCPVDDAAGLRTSMKLRRRLPHETPIVVCTTGRKDTAPLLDLAGRGVLQNVRGFSVLDEVCEHWVELVLRSPGLHEDLARRVHRSYVRHRREEGEENDPSMEPWDTLPEDLQESNRKQVADFERKIEQIGYTFVQAQDAEPKAFEFTPEQVEHLAQLEHDRWIAERLAAGWTYAPVRDVKLRTNPYLICWQCLDDPIRERDRQAMRDFSRVLADEDYVIVPMDSPPRRSMQEAGVSPPSTWSCPSCHGVVRPPVHPA